MEAPEVVRAPARAGSARIVEGAAPGATPPPQLRQRWGLRYRLNLKYEKDLNYEDSQVTGKVGPRYQSVRKRDWVD